MPPRDPPLPEGTDQIIDTANDVGGSQGLAGTGGGQAGASLSAGATGMGTSGSGATGTGTPSMTDINSGSGATGDTSAFQFNEGRNAAGGTSGGDNGGKSGVSKAADTIVNQLKDQVSSLRSTAGDKARSYAVDGKSQATDLLRTLAEIVQDATGSVENRLGGQYAGVGNRAAEQISSLASTLDEREIDELIDDARAFVRRSPAVAIGLAAVVGFAVARVVRSGVEEMSSQSGGGGGTIGSGTRTDVGTGATGPGSGATGGLDATSGGFGEQGVGTAGTLGGTGTGAGTSGVGSSAPSY